MINIEDDDWINPRTLIRWKKFLEKTRKAFHNHELDSEYRSSLQEDWKE